MMMWGMWGWNI